MLRRNNLTVNITKSWVLPTSLMHDFLTQTIALCDYWFSNFEKWQLAQMLYDLCVHLSTGLFRVSFITRWFQIQIVRMTSQEWPGWVFQTGLVFAWLISFELCTSSWYFNLCRQNAVEAGGIKPDWFLPLTLKLFSWKQMSLLHSEQQESPLYNIQVLE